MTSIIRVVGILLGDVLLVVETTVDANVRRSIGVNEIDLAVTVDDEIVTIGIVVVDFVVVKELVKVVVV